MLPLCFVVFIGFPQLPSDSIQRQKSLTSLFAAVDTETMFNIVSKFTYSTYLVSTFTLTLRMPVAKRGMDTEQYVIVLVFAYHLPSLTTF